MCTTARTCSVQGPAGPMDVALACSCLRTSELCCNDNVLHWYRNCMLRSLLCPDTQVDTPVRKLLLGIAVTYTALIVVLPFLNVFVQVKPYLIPAFSGHCIVEYARGYTFCSG